LLLYCGSLTELGDSKLATAGVCRAKGALQLVPPAQEQLMPREGPSSAGIMADAGGLHVLGPAPLALFPCSPVHPAVQHAVTPPFRCPL